MRSGIKRMNLDHQNQIACLKLTVCNLKDKNTHKITIKVWSEEFVSGLHPSNTDPHR